MRKRIVMYWVGWHNGRDGQGRGGFVRLKLEDESDHMLHVSSVEGPAALNQILQSNRSVFFDSDEQLIQTDWQRVA
jgi:hypothetical protein